MTGPALRTTLAGVAARLAEARDPWWIITGAAAALYGVVTEVADVDVLTSRADATRLLRADAAPRVPSDRYRSAVFGRIAGLPLPVEIMAGFELFAGGAWRPVRFATREAIVVNGATLFVPGRAELIALLETIGRPKDLNRAVMLAI